MTIAENKVVRNCRADQLGELLDPVITVAPARIWTVGGRNPFAQDADMNDYDASKYAAEFLKRCDVPIWRYRSGQLGRLLGWCTERASEEAVRTGCTGATLVLYLEDALGFAGKFHEALNPAGARLLAEGPPPPGAVGDRNRHIRWPTLTGTVWNHDDLENRLPEERDVFEGKEIAGITMDLCVEWVLLALYSYLKRPYLHHPWLEWCMLDALMRAETIAASDHVHVVAYDVRMPSRLRQGRPEKPSSAHPDRRNARGAARNAAPSATVFAAVLAVYRGLAGKERTISPGRIREVMVMAQHAGGRWSPACWALVDRACVRDAAIWNIEPP